MPPRDATTHTTLDEEMLVNVGEGVKLHVSILESSIPGQTWRGVIMGWVQLVFFQADGVEILKDISEKECVCEEVEVMIVLECLTLKSLQGCLA